MPVPIILSGFFPNKCSFLSQIFDSNQIVWILNLYISKKYGNHYCWQGMFTFTMLADETANFCCSFQIPRKNNFSSPATDCIPNIQNFNSQLGYYLQIFCSTDQISPPPPRQVLTLIYWFTFFYIILLDVIIQSHLSNWSVWTLELELIYSLCLRFTICTSFRNWTFTTTSADTNSVYNIP